MANEFGEPTDDVFKELDTPPDHQSEEVFRAVLRMILRQMWTEMREQKAAHAKIASDLDSLREFRWRREGVAAFLLMLIPLTLTVVLFLLGKR